MTSGFRWMFWFAPMWLAAMLPAADRWPADVDAGRRPGAVGRLRAFGKLSHLEPLDPSLAAELSYMAWVDQGMMRIRAPNLRATTR